MKRNYYPAFPVPSNVNDDGETHDAKLQGMSLRDWFAGQAMGGILSFYDFRDDKERAARKAYLFADAMIAEREKVRP